MANLKDFELTESIAEVFSRLSATKNRLAKLFSSDETDTNIPDGAIRFANNRFEIYSLASNSWSELVAKADGKYDINVDQLDGFDADHFVSTSDLGHVASAGANSDITSLNGLTTPLSVAQGGTGATTAEAAITTLLPSKSSDAGKVLKSNGSSAAWGSAINIMLKEPPLATSIDLVGIPPWAQRVTVHMRYMSALGSSPLELRLGCSDSIIASNYQMSQMETTNGTHPAVYSSTTGCRLGTSGPEVYLHGDITFSRCTPPGATWNMSGMLSTSTGKFISVAGTCYDSKLLNLDRIRLTTQNGTDMFNPGGATWASWE